MGRTVTSRTMICMVANSSPGMDLEADASVIGHVGPHVHHFLPLRKITWRLPTARITIVFQPSRSMMLGSVLTAANGPPVPPGRYSDPLSATGILVFEDVGLECLLAALVAIPDAAVGRPHDAVGDGQFEIIKRIGGEQIARRVARTLPADQQSVLDFPDGLAFRFPARQVLAVEQFLSRAASGSAARPAVQRIDRATSVR